MKINLPTATGAWGPPQFRGAGEDDWGMMGWSGYGKGKKWGFVPFQMELYREIFAMLIKRTAMQSQCREYVIYTTHT